MYKLVVLWNILPHIMQMFDFILRTKTFIASTTAAGEVQHSMCERTERWRQIINVGFHAVKEMEAGLLFPRSVKLVMLASAFMSLLLNSKLPEEETWIYCAYKRLGLFYRIGFFERRAMGVALSRFIVTFFIKDSILRAFGVIFPPSWTGIIQSAWLRTGWTGNLNPIRNT